MVAPILATKLYIPPPRPKVVSRPHLIERLNEGLGRKLTLISAPAGFGKTTLVSEWIASYSQQRERKLDVASQVQAAWLSLDEGDSDPARFLTYLVAALQTIVPNIGERVLDTLQSAPPLPIEPFLTTLLNEISAIPGHLVLVLDDYHLIDDSQVGATRSAAVSNPIDEALTFLLEHLPAQMHLVITTREDPRLPLARLRARGQLTELRASDLRFTPGEAAEFINQVMGLNLSPEDVTALENRTEGWIAGLQLAALGLQDTLSMGSNQGASEFIQAFAGDHRYIVDYLVEEVLQRQPKPVRSFLLQTSILDRLNGSLCDAVTGQDGGGARLQVLQRGNFFVVPLDDRRNWYRYHHLFAEVLSVHLMAEQPDQVAALHRRASAWFEQNGSADDAIRHALAARDFERAADLVERAVPAMRRNRQEATMLRWLKALPGELFRCRPVLSVYYAGGLLMSGDLEGVELRLRDAERWLDMPAVALDQPQAFSAQAISEGCEKMVVVDEEQFRSLPGSIAIYRAAIALTLGDSDGTVRYARRALDLIPEEDHLGQGAALGLLSLAYWASGDLELAHRTYTRGVARLQKAGHISDAIGSTIALADIRVAQGRLREAMRTYERGLQLATEQGGPMLRGAADMYVGMSELRREQNDLDDAAQYLLTSEELGEFNGLPQNRYRSRVALARIREARGDLDDAIDLLHEAEQRYTSDLFPNVRPIAAMIARVWIGQGRLAEALDWAQAQSLSTADELSYLREFEHITLARLLLAQYQHDRTGGFLLEALGLLERLLKSAENGGRMGSAIEILALLALARQMQGNLPAALAPLERALTFAEPEGYARVFVDEGQPMAQLLQEAAARGILPGYTGRLLAALESEQQKGAGSMPLPTSPAAQSLEQPAPQPDKDLLVEPLSQRELDVLRLFNTELTGPEIARELMVALSTVRTHTKSIYSKLNVNNRRAAVKRAAELHLI